MIEFAALGNELRELVLARTGLRPSELVCPREKSAMTPCVARDGGVAVVEIYGRPACVGCEAMIDILLDAMKLKTKG